MEGDPAADVVDRLVALGLERDRALEAVAQRRVLLAVLEHALAGSRRHSAEEVLERTGLDASTLHGLDRAVGIAPSDGYREVDVAHLEALAKLLVFIPADTLVEVVQSNIAPLTAIALRSLESFREQLLKPMRAAEPDEVEVARMLAAAARPLLELSGTALEIGFRRSVLHLLDSELVAAATRDEEEVPLAVGFADVVGYTSLTARVDPSGLAGVLDAFERRCYDLAADHVEVRIVKFMGDAVMAVSVDPVALAQVLLTLVEEEPEPGDPLEGVPRRAGMAAGGVLLRGGDYYGKPVNLAARLTDLAKPGTLLVAEDLRAALGDFDLRRLRPVHLHGLGRHRPLRVRPPEASD